jgi:glycosyltransferase involved in cell wall biosynthesis
LRDGLGVWIAKEDLNEFSQTVIKLLSDEEAQERLSETGRDYAQSWSASKQAERMIAFYQSVIVPAKIHELNVAVVT